MTTMRESLAAKMTAGAIAVVMTLSAFSTFAQTANAATDIEELCALATSLGISTPEFDALCAGDSEDDSAGAGEYVHHPSIDFEFTRNLYIGSRGNDVMMLQRVLNQDPDTQVAASGVGSAGQETEYFGELTRAAVAKFQAKHGISPAAGYFYPLTRAEMNRKAAGSSDDDDDDDSSDVSGDTLEVEAGDQPDDMLVGGGQIHIPTTVVEMTAGDENVDISSVMVEVTGLARQDVDSVSVWHDGVILDTDSVNSDDEAELDFDLEVDDGETAELTFSATMKDTADLDKDGLEFTLEVVEVDAGGADVDGLPVDGTEHEVNDNVELNTYEIDIDTETASDIRVGNDEEMIANVEFFNTNDDEEDDSMYVQQFAMEQVGGADLDDLDNIYVEVDGEEYDGEVSGDYVIFEFGSGVEIEEDEDMDFEVFADIVNGAGDEIVFALDADDIVDWVFVVDEEDRLLAASATETDDADTEGFDIQTGDASSDDSDEVRDGNVAPGEEDAEMASFELDIDGENVVDGEVVLVFDISNDDDDMELDNVTIVDEDGNVIAAEDENELDATDDEITVTFEDVMFPEGDETYYILADINDNAINTESYTASSATFSDFEGEDSEEDVDLGGPITFDGGVTQTVQGPAIEFGEDATLDKDTARSGQDDVELAIITMDTTDSGENVEVDTISLDFDVATSGSSLTASEAAEEITSCVLVDEDGDEVSDEVNELDALTDQEFDMSSTLTVPEDTVMTLSLMCDLGNGFVDTDEIQVDVDGDDDNYEVEAADSSEDVTITDNGGDNGEEITIDDGAVTAQNGEEATYASVRTGQEMVYLGSVELDSDEVEGNLDELTLAATGTDKIKSGAPISISTDEDGDDVVVTFYMSEDGTYTIEESDWDEVVEIEDGINEMYLWTNTANAVGTEGETLQVNIASSTVYVDGDDFATGATTTVSGVSVYSGLATFASEAVDSNDVNSDDVLMKFAITAEGEDIVIDADTATSVETTGSATTGVVSISYDDSDYDDAVDSGTALTAGDLTINEGETYYFVVKSSTAVDEGDNDDKIRTTVEFDNFITVGGVAIDPVESDLEDFSDNAESLVHTYTN